MGGNIYSQMQSFRFSLTQFPDSFINNTFPQRSVFLILRYRWSHIFYFFRKCIFTQVIKQGSSSLIWNNFEENSWKKSIYHVLNLTHYCQMAMQNTTWFTCIFLFFHSYFRISQVLSEMYCDVVIKNGRIFRVTGPLCGESSGLVNSPRKGSVMRSFDVSLMLATASCWSNTQMDGD